MGLSSSKPDLVWQSHEDSMDRVWQQANQLLQHKEQYTYDKLLQEAIALQREAESLRDQYCRTTNTTLAKYDQRTTAQYFHIVEVQARGSSKGTLATVLNFLVGFVRDNKVQLSKPEKQSLLTQLSAVRKQFDDKLRIFNGQCDDHVITVFQDIHNAAIRVEEQIKKEYSQSEMETVPLFASGVQAYIKELQGLRDVKFNEIIRGDGDLNVSLSRGSEISDSVGSYGAARSTTSTNSYGGASTASTASTIGPMIWQEPVAPVPQDDLTDLQQEFEAIPNTDVGQSPQPAPVGLSQLSINFSTGGSS